MIAESQLTAGRFFIVKKRQSVNSEKLFLSGGVDMLSEIKNYRARNILFSVIIMKFFTDTARYWNR
jgi:hypothetical protein